MELKIFRFYKYLFLSHITAFTSISGYFILFGEKLFMESLKLPYIFISILVIYFHLFLPITAASVFIVIIMTNKQIKSNNCAENGLHLIFSTFPFLVASAAMYLMTVLFIEPVLISKKAWLEELSIAGKSYEEKARQNYYAGKFETADVFTDLFLYIDPNNGSILDLKGIIKIALSTHYDIDTTENSPTIERLLTGPNFLQAAKSFFNEKDYSTAIYYSRLAGGFKLTRKEAEKITIEAEAILSQYIPDKSREEKLFDGKIKINSLIADKDFYNAYYLYQRFLEEYPEDMELKLLGHKFFSLLSEISFFYEDIQEIYFAPGKKRIGFINYSGKNGKELILAEKIVLSKENIYFFDIDIINLSPEGEIERHLYALYGKAIGDTINMQCIGKETKLFLLPQVLIGEKKDSVSSVKLNVPREILLYTGFEPTRFDKISTILLAENLELLSSIGIGKNSPKETLLVRIIRIFNFFILNIAVIAIAISFLKQRKVNKGKRDYSPLLLLPFIVLFTFLAENISIYLKINIIWILIETKGIFVASFIIMLIIIAEIIILLLYTIKKASQLLNTRN